MPGPYTLAELTVRLGGRVAGDSGIRIRQVGSLEHAMGDQIAFLADPRQRAKLQSTQAAAVVLAPESEALTSLARIVTDNPYAYFARVSQLLNPAPVAVPGIDSLARVAPSASIAPTARIEAGAVIGERVQIGERAWIGAGSFLGDDVAVGAETRLYPSVSIYAHCRIGARVILHSGAVIGADGFGGARDGDRWIKLPQIGRVLIGDDVEVGANTTIDRGALDDTVIEEGVKLDNQIQIGHNVRVGAHTAMAGFAGVAGSADIGRHCVIGAAAVILGHLRIPDGTRISAGTVISRSIREPGTYTGLFPFDRNDAWARNTAWLRHLGDLADRVRALERSTGVIGKEHND